MFEVLITVIISCAVLVALVLVKPTIEIKGVSISIYWLAPLVGAILIVVLSLLSPQEVVGGLLRDSDVNPIKILVLFISMTVISVFLDNAGFFRYLASIVLSKSNFGQMGLFAMLYAMVSVLTIFTSNDIIVLTFTPFICYFAHSAGIDPIPYLIGEFIAANTWSMALIIGNPTNIYLASNAGVSFFGYCSTMLLPTLLAGIVSFAILCLLFQKKLRTPICYSQKPFKLPDKPLVVIGVVHLACCIILMSVSSYIRMPMWLISLGFCISLLLISSIYIFITAGDMHIIGETFKRIPFDVIPFVISMFTLVLALDKFGITKILGSFLSRGNSILTFGISSFLTANVINNIPMSVLFSSIIETIPVSIQTQSLYAAVIGSNLGAFFTPIGALAGIMWMGLLKHHHVKLTFLQFIKYGAVISVAALGVALGGLMLTL